MDPATILSVVATSSKLAKTAWDFGEVLYTFAKDAKIINKTLSALIAQVRAVREPCELLALFLDGVKDDLEVHPHWVATRHGMQLSDTMKVVQRQLDGCDRTLDSLFKSTEGDPRQRQERCEEGVGNLQIKSSKGHDERMPLPVGSTPSSFEHDITYHDLQHEQQSVDDLAEEIEALREQTIALQSQPPTVPGPLDLEQLLILGQETVAEGETIYAQSIAGGSTMGDDAVAASGSAHSISAWLHQQAIEAGRLSLPPATDANDDVLATSAIPDSAHAERISETVNEMPEEMDDDLYVERKVISNLLDGAIKLFKQHNYHNARLRLETTVAVISGLPLAARGTYNFFEIQYMLGVATFYSTESENDQRIFLDVVGQQASTDKQRLQIAHGSRLLAEAYVHAGDLETARTSCISAIRVYQRLKAGSRYLNKSFALAARIEHLLGNTHRADAYTYSISAPGQQGFPTHYVKLTPEEGLTIKQREDLMSSKSELSEKFHLNNETGKVQVRPNTDYLMDQLTQLHLAVMFCDISYTSSLIEEGADVNAQAPPDSYIMYRSGIGALTPLLCAIRNRHKNMIRLIVSKGATLAMSETSSPVLALADKELYSSDDAPNLYSMMTCFKHLGWEIDLPADHLGQCMLHVAAENNNLELVRALVSHEANTCVREQYGSVALQVAVRNLDHATFLVMAKTLLQINPLEQLNDQDDAGQTVLHHIATRNSRTLPAQTASFLIARGSSVLSQDDNGITPLHVAISNWGDGDVIRNLLRVQTAEQLCIKNFQRQTPLQIALATDSVRAYVVLDLLAAGADPLEMIDSSGKTPAQHIYRNFRPHGGQDPSRVLDSEIWDWVWEILMKKPSLRELFAGLDRLDEEVSPSN
ncbi:hypothetical protein Q7P35_005105 [Cladosporium inversicolor]